MPTPDSDSVAVPRRLWEQWRHARAQAKTWDERAKKLRGQLEKVLGTHTLATINGIPVISWKETEKIHKFDMDAFKKDYPELVAEYTILKPGTRPFNECEFDEELLDGGDE